MTPHPNVERVRRLQEWHAQDYATKYGVEMAELDRLFAAIDARLVPMELAHGLYGERDFLPGVHYA